MKATNGAPLSSALGALGIVYGDIGTSVLYAFRECLEHGIRDQEGILGILSLIIWTLTLLVTFKYVTFVIRADNQGEGGILALLSLAFPESVTGGRRSQNLPGMIAIGVTGAALLYGDGVITPAISVLSATEGLSVAAPWLAPFTVPLTVVILVLLFAFQRKGTESVAKLFGPVMLVWFLTLAITGIVHIVRHPTVFEAINPLHAALFRGLPRRGVACGAGKRLSGSDRCRGPLCRLGTFRTKAHRSGMVLGCLPFARFKLLGQGALILREPGAHSSPFFHMVPSWLLWPLIALATAATVIASQALISGAYSLTMQAVQMGYVPFINIRHTSHEEHGQIYIPQVNTLLALGCVALVVGFKSSNALASAYGIAVTLAMLATTLLLSFAARRLWKWSAMQIGALCTPLFAVEGNLFCGQ